jgi:integrase
VLSENLCNHRHKVDEPRTAKTRLTRELSILCFGCIDPGDPKIRDVLSSIVGSAKKYGLLVTNPVEGVQLPPSRRGKRVKLYVTPAQFGTLIELIPEPYASMVFVAIYTGLRVSEVIGLRWAKRTRGLPWTSDGHKGPSEELK